MTTPGESRSLSIRWKFEILPEPEWLVEARAWLQWYHVASVLLVVLACRGYFPIRAWDRWERMMMLATQMWMDHETLMRSVVDRVARGDASRIRVISPTTLPMIAPDVEQRKREQ